MDDDDEPGISRHATGGVTVRYLNADFEEAFVCDLRAKISLSLDKVREKHGEQIEVYHEATELTGDELVGELTRTHCLFLEVWTLTDRAVLSCAKQLRESEELRSAMGSGDEISREIFLQSFFESAAQELVGQGLRSQAKLAWLRMANHSETITRACFNHLLQIPLEVLAERVTLQKSLDINSEKLTTVKRGAVLVALNNPVEHNDRVRRFVQFGDLQGYVTTVGDRGSVLVAERPTHLTLSSVAREVAWMANQPDGELDEEDFERQVEEEDAALDSAIERVRAPLKRPLLRADRRKGDRRGPRSSAIDREILRLQKPNSPELLIPKLAFHRLVREVVTDLQAAETAVPCKEHEKLFEKPFCDPGALRFTQESLLVLQSAAEALLITVLRDCCKAAAHGKRVTVMEKDLALVKDLSDGKAWIGNEPRSSKKEKEPRLSKQEKEPSSAKMEQEASSSKKKTEPRLSKKEKKPGASKTQKAPKAPRPCKKDEESGARKPRAPKIRAKPAAAFDSDETTETSPGVMYTSPEEEQNDEKDPGLGAVQSGA
eukprot:Skav211761  [mRNA]  locus=scaffold674:183245:185588:+ [translate_table: standard]